MWTLRRLLTLPLKSSLSFDPFVSRGRVREGRRGEVEDGAEGGGDSIIGAGKSGGGEQR